MQKNNTEYYQQVTGISGLRSALSCSSCPPSTERHAEARETHSPVPVRGGVFVFFVRIWDGKAKRKPDGVCFGSSKKGKGWCTQVSVACSLAERKFNLRSMSTREPCLSNRFNLHPRPPTLLSETNATAEGTCSSRTFRTW